MGCGASDTNCGGGGGGGRREGRGEGEGRLQGKQLGNMQSQYCNNIYLHHQERRQCPHYLVWGAETEQQSLPQLPSADETLPSLRLSLPQNTC